MDLFLKAARTKMRFSTELGNLNVEQLFDLTDNQLHKLYLNLESQITVSGGLLGVAEDANIEIEDKLEIVKSVFKTLKREKKAKEKEASNAQMKQKLLNILEKKQDASLEEMSEKELIKRIKSL